MYSKISSTIYRPEKPILIWDGACPFCRYWVIQLKKITGKKVEYVPYQKIHQAIPDIPKSAFKEAVRLIDKNGNVFNGAETAYWCLKWTKHWRGLIKKYRDSEFFRYVSDVLYSFASHHRSFMLKATQLFFGKDPYDTKPYWLFYLAGFVAVLVLAVIILN